MSLAVLGFELWLQVGRRAGNADLLAASLRYLSFFTNLSNFALVLVYAAALAPTERRPAWLASPLARATALSMILLTMLVYYFVLARTREPARLGQGEQHRRALHRAGAVSRLVDGLRPHRNARPARRAADADRAGRLHGPGAGARLRHGSLSLRHAGRGPAGRGRRRPARPRAADPAGAAVPCGRGPRPPERPARARVEMRLPGR